MKRLGRVGGRKVGTGNAVRGLRTRQEAGNKQQVGVFGAQDKLELREDI